MPVPSQTHPPRPLLRDSVYSRIRDAIVDGTLAPDEQLKDTELAAWLGVSRTPVREALLELSRAGLVRTLPGRSTAVAPLDTADLRDAQQVVAAMHRLAILAAVPLMTDEDLARMESANDRFRLAHRAGDVEAALDADREFHAVAVSVAGNRALTTILDTYEPVLLRAERLRFASHEGHDSAQRHAELLDLCRARDAASAAALAEGIWSSLAINDPAASESETP